MDSGENEDASVHKKLATSREAGLNIFVSEKNAKNSQVSKNRDFSKKTPVGEGSKIEIPPSTKGGQPHLRVVAKSVLIAL